MRKARLRELNICQREHTIAKGWSEIKIKHCFFSPYETENSVRKERVK